MADRIFFAALAMAAALLSDVSASHAQEAPRTGVVPASGLPWKGAGIPGVATAAVQGDMARGQSHFYLRYEKGFATPLHFHSADHFVTTIAGMLVLVVDGKEHRLPPGSYFALVNKAPHTARCEGAEDCVMFVNARSAWDVVPATK
jgi:quercetin dioxygenase-like cupin family protein